MMQTQRKNSFEDYGAEPSPLVWEKIEKRLPAPPGKKRRWVIWSIAAILVAGVFVSTYLLDVEIKLKTKESTEKIPAPSGKTTTAGEKTAAEKKQMKVTEHAKNEAAGKTQMPVKEDAQENNNIEKEKAPSEKIVLSLPEKKIRIKQKTIVPVEKEMPNVTEKTTEANKTVQPEETVVASNEPTVDQKGFVENISPLSIAMIPMPDDSIQPLSLSSIDFQPLKKKHSVSRWQVFASGTRNYTYRTLNFTSSANHTVSAEEKNYLSENEMGINTLSFETDISYSLSAHFNLNFGISYFIAGQERTQSEIIFSSGNAGSPNTLYSISTSAGVVAANGQQVDNVFFNNNDTSLFTGGPITIAGPSGPEDSSITQHFNLRQEFTFIGFPLLIQYQTAEHRFTPYVGLGFSAGYILKERTTAYGKEFDYYYRQSTNTIIFFAEAQAGVKYRISNHLFFKLQPSLRYGLSSVNGDDSIEWIPYMTGIGAGINFRF